MITGNAIASHAQTNSDVVYKALVDSDWYAIEVQRRLGTAIAPSDAFVHYRDIGAASGLDPSPLFDSNWYRSQLSNRIGDAGTPLDDYIQTGAALGLSPHPLFDAKRYCRMHLKEAIGCVNPLFDFLINGDRLRRDPSALFDVDWYISENPDVASSPLNSLKHYILYGGREGRSPHPAFDSVWYLDQNSDVAASGMNPLLHYVCYGAAEGRSPHPMIDLSAYNPVPQIPISQEHTLLAGYFDDGWKWNPAPAPLFDQEYYIKNNPDVAKSQICPFMHFLRWGAREGRIPHVLFDSRRYFSKYLDVLAAGKNPVSHYIMYGSREGRSPHSLFDSAFYLQQNADVASTNINPLVHYYTVGWREKRDPHPLFDTAGYLEQCPELLESGICPLLHFLTLGAYIGRRPNALFDPHWYEAAMPPLEGEYVNPLEHYIDFGAKNGRDPGPDFDTSWYMATNPDVAISAENPLAHYLRVGQAQGRRPLPPEHRKPAPIEVRNQVAVVFLARSETGSLAALAPFVKSYRKYAAGMQHDLIVLRKGGSRKDGASLAIELMFEQLDAQFIDFSDRGYDIQAYLKAAQLLKHEYIAFFNTHSEIKAEDWLQKLFAPMKSPTVGMAGATASYESISESTDLNCKAIWLINDEKIPYDPEIADLFSDLIAIHADDWKTRKTSTKELTYTRQRKAQYNRYWTEATRPNGPLYPLADFPRFPNPHVRTNAFIMRRDVLLSLGFNLDASKLACVFFESGSDGLPARLKQKGLRLVLVGADGRCFEEDEWVQSGTFRLDNQWNTMVYDNRVEEFFSSSPGVQKRLQTITWGQYLQQPPKLISDIGSVFARKSHEPLPTSLNAAAASARPFTISVVIPTRNRLELVKEAVYTIQQQSYPHWNCVIFDNASEQNVQTFVEELSDPRVTTIRSDQFLPVTDSWNNAIDLADGDYVLLLGDDDGITPDCFSRLKEIVERRGRPDLVYSALYQFMHPGVAPWEPAGFVDAVQNGIFFNNSNKEDFILDREVARTSVEGSVHLKRSFAFNMQAQFYEHRFLDSLRRDGKVFHSPFPDYYIANAAFALSKKTVVVPDPIGIQGVSRKSFGFTLFNDEAERGAGLLKTELKDDPLYNKFVQYILPGLPYITNYTLTMLHVVNCLGEDYVGNVDIGRYRRLQILNSLGGETKLKQGGAPAEFYMESVRPLLLREELQFAERLISLGRRASTEDSHSDKPEETAAFELNALISEIQMYLPASISLVSRRLSTGDYLSLPGVFEAMRSKELKAF